MRPLAVSVIGGLSFYLSTLVLILWYIVLLKRKYAKPRFAEAEGGTSQ